MPLKVHELLASVDAAVEESELRKKKARQQPKQRNVFDKQQIMLAKDLLMKQKGHDRGRSTSLSAKKQYGKRGKYDRDSPDGTFHIFQLGKNV